ncbi:hypothetical protein DPMN_169911 [Dreissena polymorpha]|uniref:Uncharacterized protein n=1 Tax=Dreissena polymorpha TaxID=45954 RepID=A0A9D4DYS4_DREPO|nr:hypothetical protein DPMN_169911 [Dreissena polymorpha]
MRGGIREKKGQVHRAARSVQPKRLAYLLCPIEVGAKEFCAVRSTGKDRRRTIQKLSQAAERSCSWLYLRRKEATWKR